DEVVVAPWPCQQAAFRRVDLRIEFVEGAGVGDGVQDAAGVIETVVADREVLAADVSGGQAQAARCHGDGAYRGPDGQGVPGDLCLHAGVRRSLAREHIVASWPQKVRCFSPGRRRLPLIWSFHAGVLLLNGFVRNGRLARSVESRER